MDLLYYLYYSSDFLELVKTYILDYSYYLVITLLIISVLNCFFGFHLRKVWGIFAGMGIGAAISACLCIYIGKTGTILYLIAVFGAFTLGLLALLLYRAGLFFIGTLAIPLLLSRLFPTENSKLLFLWLILGLFTGAMTLLWEKESISLLTSIGGGFATARCLMTLRDHNSLLMLVMLGLVFSMAGLFLQFQPWRDRSSWNSDEEHARDKHRHKRRMKRIRRKKKQQERAELRDAVKKGEITRSQAYTQSGFLPGKKAVQKQTTTEYTPYKTRAMYQTAIQEQPTAESSAVPADIPADIPEEPVVDPDLSDIRQLISKEVSNIYQERQQEMDSALDDLLEREYQHTKKRL